MKYLSITGNSDNVTRLFIEPKGEDKTYSLKEEKNKLILDFDAKDYDIRIELPQLKSIEINPDDIVLSGEFDWKNDRRKIDISNMAGRISVSTDGYEVNLHRNSNDMSIASYFNIFADSIWVKDEGSILLDSYFGDVYLRTLNPLDASINMRANLGEVILDSLIDLSEQHILLADKISGISGKGISDIILHSEKGDSVWIDAMKFPDSSFYQGLFEVNEMYELMQEDFEKMNEDLEGMHKDLENMEFPEMPTILKIPNSELAIISDFDNNLFDEKFIMKQNNPNPWKKKTTIEYILPHEGKAVFKVYNRWGEVLHEESQIGKTGKNQFKVDNKMVKEMGVLLYTLTFEGDTQTKNMIKIEK